MTFKRPQNITLTQMAQWVDANMHNDLCDEDMLCEYMYHLVYAHSHKHINFKDYEQLDDFCLYCWAFADCDGGFVSASCLRL